MAIDPTLTTEVGELEELHQLVASQWGLLHRLSEVANALRRATGQRIHEQVADDLGDGTPTDGIEYKHEINNTLDDIKIRASMDHQGGRLDLGYLNAKVGETDKERFTVIIELIHPYKVLPHHSMEDAKRVISEKLDAGCEWADDIEHGDAVTRRSLMFRWTTKADASQPVDGIVERSKNRLLDAVQCFDWWREAIMKSEEATDGDPEDEAAELHDPVE